MTSNRTGSMNGISNKTCCRHGPGYATPMDAFRSGTRERLLYVTCVRRNLVPDKPDFLATVDVDPDSPTYSRVISRLDTLSPGDEIHHSGWNACSSCYDDPSKSRSRLILPCLHSDRVYVIDTVTDPRNPRIEKVIDTQEVHQLNVSFLHTSHCLPSGHVMISTMGTIDDEPRGSFVMINSDNWSVDYEWGHNGAVAPMGYDYWYQPRHNVMISTEWGSPAAIKSGFNPQDVADGKYGRHLNVWNWNTHEKIGRIDLGPDGLIPLEVRFLHDPDEVQGYTGCALSSTVFRFYLDEDDKEWKAEKVIEIPSKEVENWILPTMPALITDILLSLDDKYLYVSCWLHGDIRQYDISDRRSPRLVGQVFIAGSICKDGPVKVTKDAELKEQPDPIFIKGKRVEGGGQMLQLSLDGKRLYVTTSLYSEWDKQFYPEMMKKGASIHLIDVDTETGGLTINKEFGIIMDEESGGPALMHEMRYPGGDCTSDIWI